MITNNTKQKSDDLSHEPDLPVQCKCVVELYMGVRHGVKGRELLQSLHQLHDGLVILDDKPKLGHRAQPPPPPQSCISHKKCICYTKGTLNNSRRP